MSSTGIRRVRLKRKSDIKEEKQRKRPKTTQSKRILELMESPCARPSPAKDRNAKNCVQLLHRLTDESVKIDFRDNETNQLEDFLDSSSEPYSCFLSGNPGTGKTALTRQLLDARVVIESVYVNLMKHTLNYESRIEELIFGLSEKHGFDRNLSIPDLARELNKRGFRFVLVLDEMDWFFDRKEEANLLKYLQLASSGEFQLILIANVFQLDARKRDPNWQKIKIRDIRFHTYTKEDLVKIVHKRLGSYADYFDELGLVFCARHGEAIFRGDCRRVLSLLEQTVLRKKEMNLKDFQITIKDINNIISEVNTTSAQGLERKLKSLTFQQIFVLACVARLQNKITLRRVHETCRQQADSLNLVIPTDFRTVSEAIEFLETTRLVKVTPATTKRQYLIDLENREDLRKIIPRCESLLQTVLD